MNIDILNANCGLGYSRGHACLRVGLKYLSRVVVCSRDGSSRSDVVVVGGGGDGLPGRKRAGAIVDCRARSQRERSRRRRLERRRRGATSSEIETVRSVDARCRTRLVRSYRNDGTVARMMRLRIGPAPSFRAYGSLGVCGVVGRTIRLSRATVLSSRRHHRFRPEIRRDYPLNLSILISGGKETNQDSLSNGE